MQFKPSKYQQAILKAVSETRDNLVIEAVAGSGKSSTLQLICAALQNPARAILLAFNTSICKELTERFKRAGIFVKVQGINSAGNGMLYKALGSVTLDNSKYTMLVSDAIKDSMINDPDGEIFSSFVDLVSFAMTQLVDVKDRKAVLAVANKFGVDMLNAEAEDFMLTKLPMVIKAGDDMAKTLKIVAFIDQLYLPVVWDLKPWQYETVMVDEAQDLSPVQLALVRKLCMKGGRIVAVGDSKQAIYNFAGADSESMQNIVKATNAKILPLSICYRCPRSHVELAKGIVPQIEASETAIEGTVEELSRQNFPDRVQEGDLVLSRTTAPLVSACFQLIGLGMPARIKGRSIGEGLVKLLRKIQKGHGGNALAIENVLDAIRSHREKCFLALEGQKDTEAKKEKLDDQIDCLIAIYELGKPEMMGSPSTKTSRATGFYAEIEELFTEGRPGVTLSTVHKAKGLEEKRVFILGPENFPHSMAKTKDQKQQEYHIKYVAYTRSKESLFLVPLK